MPEKPSNLHHGGSVVSREKFVTAKEHPIGLSSSY